MTTELLHLVTRENNRLPDRLLLEWWLKKILLRGTRVDLSEVAEIEFRNLVTVAVFDLSGDASSSFLPTHRSNSAVTTVETLLSKDFIILSPADWEPNKSYRRGLWPSLVSHFTFDLVLLFLRISGSPPVMQEKRSSSSTDSKWSGEDQGGDTGWDVGKRLPDTLTQIH